VVGGGNMSYIALAPIRTQNVLTCLRLMDLNSYEVCQYSVEQLQYMVSNGVRVRNLELDEDGNFVWFQGAEYRYPQIYSCSF
jgi:hypothetical protein